MTPGYCVICGRHGTNRHHVIPGERKNPRNPILELCGSGTTGCHGRVHERKIHFRYVGRWEMLGTEHAMKYDEALAREGWDTVVTPYLLPLIPYRHNSAGIRACHRLIHELNERGYPAYAEHGNPDWHELPATQCPPGAIVIYPEVVHGNPLRAERVVRWVLNTPGLLGGDKTYAPSEQVWTWSHRFTLAPILTVDIMEHELFFPVPGQRDGDCCYIGKGKGSPLAGMPCITHDWPPTRAEVASLLQRTEVLYTYDDCTSLTDEAIMCGAKVVLLPSGEELTSNLPTAEQHEARLQAFIKATQARWA